MNRLAFYIGIENLEEIKNMDNLYLKAKTAGLNCLLQCPDSV